MARWWFGRPDVARHFIRGADDLRKLFLGYCAARRAARSWKERDTATANINATLDRYIAWREITQLERLLEE